MNEPRGYNPIGEHAPSTSKHNKQLPGHVSGEYTPPPGSADEEPPMSAPATGGVNPWVGDGKLVVRIFLIVVMWLAAPVLALLYPIAGIGGAAAAAIAYFVTHGHGSEDAARNWAWGACFIGWAAMMRFETGIETRSSSYVRLRSVLRLAFIAAWFFFVETQLQQEQLPKALLMSAIVTAIAFFVLRSKIAKGFAELAKDLMWLRKQH
jgi:hypothetical protein